MPTNAKPTNEAVIGLLERILAEIEILKEGQRTIVGEVRQLAGAADR